MFLRWIWYAARRDALHLDEADDDFATEERLTASLRIVGPALRLGPGEESELVAHARLTRYAAEETLQFAGEVPRRMSFIVNGKVKLFVAGDDGEVVPVRTLSRGDFIGQTALTREAVSASARAVDEVTVVQVDREHVEELVARKPLLLQDIGRTIEDRRRSARRALAAVRD
jgi:CRP-like cAMP-binding protein